VSAEHGGISGGVYGRPDMAIQRVYPVRASYTVNILTDRFCSLITSITLIPLGRSDVKPPYADFDYLFSNSSFSYTADQRIHFTVV